MKRRTRAAQRPVSPTAFGPTRSSTAEMLEDRRLLSTLAVLTKDARLLTLDTANTQAIVSNRRSAGSSRRSVSSGSTSGRRPASSSR